MRRLMLLMAIALPTMLFAQDPYMNHPYPSYDGWWLFCGFDGDGYVKGVRFVLHTNYTDYDTVKFGNFLFTSDTVLGFFDKCPRSEVDTTSGWFDVKVVRNDTVRWWVRNDTSAYHFYLNDVENSVVLDFDIEPSIYHSIFSHYFGTLEASLVGTVKIGAEEYPVTGNCSFEHAWGEGIIAAVDSLPTRDAFSHYEPVALYDSLGTDYGSIHWPFLRTTGEGYHDARGGMSLPDHSCHSYPRDDYDLEYLEKRVINGHNVPKKWKMTAITGDGTLEYIGTGIRASELRTFPAIVGGCGAFIYSEYTGTFTPISGPPVSLTGKGVLEFGYTTHDPLYNLDEHPVHRFDFGRLEPQPSFKKVHCLSPYGPGGYGFAFSSMDLSRDADLTQYGNTGIHSDCSWLYHDFWYFWVDVPNGTYTVKLYWGVTDSILTQTFDIYDGKAGGGPYELEADSVGDATYPNEVTVEDIQIDNGAIEIQIHRNSDIFCLISALEVMRQTGVKEESNYQWSTGNGQLSIHPNPATTRSEVTFCLSAPVSRFSSLKIYDLSGRLVRSLNLCNLDKSVKSVLWDGTDNNGKEVAGGIYFCKLQTGDFRVMKKLVLLR